MTFKFKIYYLNDFSDPFHSSPPHTATKISGNITADAPILVSPPAKKRQSKSKRNLFQTSLILFFSL